jgi:5'-nucleotidase
MQNLEDAEQENNLGVLVPTKHFLGGMKKDRILSILNPHMFFDGQNSHLESEVSDIPFGMANKS